MLPSFEFYKLDWLPKDGLQSTSVKVFFQIVFLSFSLYGMTPSFGGPSGLFVSEDGLLPPRRRRPSSGIFILARFGA